MTTKLLLATGALALAGLTTASAASFEVWFGSPMEAGTVQLPPGTYRVSQDGNHAASFKNMDSGATYITPATVEHLSGKNATTNVRVVNENGQQAIQSIALGGRSVDLTFGG